MYLNIKKKKCTNLIIVIMRVHNVTRNEEGKYTGSFRKNVKLNMLIFKGCGALLELKQVAKFY
jgi:hypothetical protein